LLLSKSSTTSASGRRWSDGGDHRSERPQHIEKQAQQYRDLEDAVRAVWDRAAISYLVLEHAGDEYFGVPESEYMKVTKTNWRLLTHAIRQQEDLANALAAVYLNEGGA
jgi:hypothetical protein